MEEKKYLKWYNKIGYGSGDIAGNVVYAFLTSFMMVYLTDSVGLAAGVVGTLIAVSKLFDGFTDIFFGSMIDKTHSKMGKAKPWMLYGYIGCAITLVCCFAVPVSWGTTAKYAWFFISYTLLNGVFYTASGQRIQNLVRWISRLTCQNRKKIHGILQKLLQQRNLDIRRVCSAGKTKGMQVIFHIRQDRTIGSYQSLYVGSSIIYSIHHMYITMNIALFLMRSIFRWRLTG